MARPSSPRTASCQWTAPAGSTCPRASAGHWLVVEFAPGQSTGWHAVHCDVYVYVARGQLEFALDGGESVTVREGDLVIEGDDTLHSWTNTGDGPAIVSAVEIDLP